VLNPNCIPVNCSFLLKQVCFMYQVQRGRKRRTVDGARCGAVCGAPRSSCACRDRAPSGVARRRETSTPSASCSTRSSAGWAPGADADSPPKVTSPSPTPNTEQGWGAGEYNAQLVSGSQPPHDTLFCQIISWFSQLRFRECSTKKSYATNKWKMVQ